MDYKYDFIRLDGSSPDAPTLVRKYRDMRLTALQLAPGLFASNYAVESAISEADWAQRVFASGKETFVCVATPLLPPSAGDAVAAEPEWVAQVTVIGPIPAESYLMSPEVGEETPLPDDQEEKWHLLALYAVPEHRGRQLGRRLCQAALAWILERQSEPSRLRVRLVLHPDNSVALKLYLSMGFAHAGLCTRAEAMISNGEREMLPKGELGPDYTTRKGLVMNMELKRPQ